MELGGKKPCDALSLDSQLHCKVRKQYNFKVGQSGNLMEDLYQHLEQQSLKIFK